MIHRAIAILIACTSLLLIGCGQTGPLYLPESEALESANEADSDASSPDTESTQKQTDSP